MHRLFKAYSISASMSRLKRKKELHSPAAEDVRFGTPSEVAVYRAQRFKEYDTIIEVGAGAGFQTGEFAKVAKVIAIEIDGERMRRGHFGENVQQIIGDALDPAVIAQIKPHGKTVVFLDPERPAQATRRTLDEIQPNIERFLTVYNQFSADIAIELPPFLSELPAECEREYLSIDNQLNRLTVYFGGLKKCDISVVQLPSGKRFEHNGDIPPPKNGLVQPLFLLEPDAALQHAGLAHVALDKYEEIHLGKKKAYLTEKPNELFRVYKIRAIGKNVEQELQRCGTVILHGSMTQEQQRLLLRKLRPHCRGKLRMHLFLAEERYLTTLT
jgi:hypothetical protein